MRLPRTPPSILLVTAALAGCGPTLPHENPVARALVLDTERVVNARGQVGWLIDELEVRAILPDLLASACRVTPEQRAAALAWLTDQIAKDGGPVEEAFAARGGDLDEVEELLLLTRARAALETADRWAKDGKCPFWVKPEDNFRGLQGMNGHWFLLVEGGGRFFAQLEDSDPGLGGGGTFRLLAGRGLSGEVSLMSGIDVGGAGRFTAFELGKRLEIPEVVGIAAVPVVTRLHGLSSHVDLEAGPLLYVNQLRGDAQFGVRIGAGVGLSRLLVRGFIPGFSFSMSYDLIPGLDGLPTVHQLGMGMRGFLALPL